MARRGGKMRALASLKPPHEKIQVCLLDAVRLRHALSYCACAFRVAAEKVYVKHVPLSAGSGTRHWAGTRRTQPTHEWYRPCRHPEPVPKPAQRQHFQEFVVVRVAAVKV